MVRRLIGDFIVGDDEFKEAQEAFEERSRRSQALDRAFRAPVTDDVDRWKRNQRGLDFPGVDTPTSEPTQAMMDFPLPDERGRLAKGQQQDTHLSEDAATKPIDDLLGIPDEQADALKRGMGLD